MNFSDILLIIVSSAGLLHGVVIAYYLIFFKNKKITTNYLLGFILIFMAFRIGKSVMLNFGENLQPVFIFLGLTFLLLIGPFLRWYVIGMTQVNFKIEKKNYIELIPFISIFIASLFVTEEWYKNSKWVLIIFSSGLIFIYLHFLFYIILSWIVFKGSNKKQENKKQTKSQKVTFEWLRLLIIGFVIIWVSYVFNILDETIPYISGPILYSLIIYYLSYKAFQLKVTDIDGNVFKENNNQLIFDHLTKMVIQDKLYIDSELTLSKLSKLLGKTKQKTSEIINQCSNKNFNDFINYYRIEESKKMLLEKENKNFTIASIAFDVGFNTLSSFNYAFKKLEGVTPSVYKKKEI